MISMGSMVTSGALLQSHLLSTTTMKRLLLGICCMTKDLQPKQRRYWNYNVLIIKMDIICKGVDYLMIQ